MQDFGTKADDTAGPSGQLSAAEFNNLATELENAILRSGQALNAASVVQMAASLFLHAVKAQTFQDNGLANAYVATPVSGSGGVLLPADYANMNGTVIVIQASAANTGASTMNIGQTTGTLLGTKAIVDQAGAAITIGAIAAGSYIQLRYDASIGAGSWVLLPASRPVASTLQAQQQLLNNVLLTPQTLDAAFQGANQSMAIGGFQRIAGGWIAQWGSTTTIASGANATTNYPMAFPNACFRVLTTVGTSANINQAYTGATSSAPAANSFDTYSFGTAGSSTSYHWFAVGN
jgi:hypothetical protein